MPWKSNADLEFFTAAQLSDPEKVVEIVKGVLEGL
jgi:hypothetical protein